MLKRLNAAALVLCLFEAARYGLGGDVGGAAFAAFAAVTFAMLVVGRFVFLALALLAGAWLLAAALGLSIAVWLAQLVLSRFERLESAAMSAAAALDFDMPGEVAARFDEAALLNVARSVEDLVAGIDPPITTASLVVAAKEADPDRWRALGDFEPQLYRIVEPALGDGWTRPAAEAVLTASFLQRDGSRPDLHDIAAATLVHPYTAAGDMLQPWLGRERWGHLQPKVKVGEVVRAVCGLDHGRFIKAMEQAAATNAGVLIFRLDSVAVPWAYLDDDERVSASETRRPADPVPETPSPWEPAATASADKTSAVTPQEPALPAPEEPQVSTPASAPPDAAEPSPGGAAAEPEPKRSRGGYAYDDTRWRTVLARCLREYSPIPLLLWWFGKPVATLTAVLLSAAEVPDRPWLALASLAAVISVRPVRRWWCGLLLAALCAPLSVWVAAVVLVRTAATGLTVGLPGLGARALRRVAAHRRALTFTPDLDEAWLVLREQVEDEEAVDILTGSGPVLLISGWASADLRIQLRTFGQLASGLLFARWPFGYAGHASVALWQIGLIQGLLPWLGRVTAILTAAGTAAFWPGAPDWHLLGVNCAAVAAAVLTGLITMCIGRISCASLLLLVLVSVASLVMLRGHGLMVLAIGAAAGGVSILVSSFLGALRPAGSGKVPRPPWLARTHADIRRYVAASRALEDGRADEATRLWTRLAQSDRARPSARVLSLASLADLALQSGDLQGAVELADRAAEPGRRPGWADAHVGVVLARIRVLTGDFSAARKALPAQAATPRQLRRDAALLQAESLAETGDLEAAWSAFSRATPGFGATSAGQLLEGATAVTLAMGRTDPKAAVRRLESIIDIAGGDLDAYIPREADRRRMATITTRAHVTLGHLRLRADERLGAAEALRLGVRNLEDAPDPVALPIARMLLGCAVAAGSRPDEALSGIARGIADLEEMRGGLRKASLRGGLAARIGDVYTLVLDELCGLSLQDSGAAEVAATLLESLRRNALAELLRTHAAGQPPALRGLLDEINAAEERDGSGESAELMSLRARLGAIRSDAYATAYVPAPVSFAEIRAVLGEAHALLYRVSRVAAESVEGHVVWMPPAGDSCQIAPFRIDGAEAMELIGAADGDDLLWEDQLPGSPAADAWDRVSRVLLPEAFVASLETGAVTRLVIAPDGPLTALPWPGLGLPDGRLLIDATVPQITSALSLLRPGSVPPEPRREPVTVLLHQDGEAAEPCGERLAADAVIVRADSRAEIGRALDSHRPDGAYFSVHGVLAGFDQGLRLGDGTFLSAASAPDFAWPRWTVFAACTVGEMDIRPGHEPNGLTTGCLLGGAGSIVSAVIDCDADKADRLCLDVAARLIGGAEAPMALRDAQLAYLAARGSRLTYLAEWAGFVCVSGTVPPTRQEGTQ